MTMMTPTKDTFMSLNSIKASSSSPVSPPAYLNIFFGFLGAGTATTICHPLDVARVRSMVAGNSRGWMKAMLVTGQNEGISGLWTGLSAGLIRQLFYGATRFGCFESFQDWRKSKLTNGQTNISALEKTLCALAAGGLAGFVGNPPDVALTRMASDIKLPPELRRGYKNGFQAMYRLAKEEGFRKGLMCGAVANVQRSILVNGVMLGSYAQSRQEVQKLSGLRTSSPILTFLAGNFAGFATALVAVPADFCKTRLQYAQVDQYKGVLDLINKTVAERGLIGLYAGFWPFWAKLAPHTTISFIVIENCRDLWMKF
jgi:solute carrier family 25 oxoglutarate transporter 11